MPKGHLQTKETRLKISKALKGKKFSKERRDNISKAKKGKKIPKLSLAKKGKIPPCTFNRRSYEGKDNPFYGKKHSEEVIEKLKKDPRVRHYGKSHWRWKGGVGIHTRKFYKSDGYYAWRNKVFERDKYTCQSCGDDRGGNLNAHHLILVNFCLKHCLFDLIFDINNGITLCEKCHKELHKHGHR